MNDARNRKQEKIVTKLEQLGARDIENIERLAEMVDALSNVIIDAYINGREDTQQSNTVL